MSLRDELKGIVPQNYLSKLPNRFDVIGDIAIVSVPQGMETYNEDIARVIMERMQNIRTVLNKTSKLEGDHRVANLEIIAGESTETIHREFGLAYSIDLKRSFFNGRLSFERKRVASLVRSGEKVLVPFSGAGPFAISAAKTAATVVAVEMNRHACKYFAINCKLNKVERNIHVINADASSIPNMLRTGFDRAIIPTPYGMDHFLESISTLVKPGGYIHFYTFKPKEDIEGLIQRYGNMGFEVLFHRRCGNVAPGISRWVFDLKK
ncbi:class I SAM-dependent methyltransferase [Methanolobus sp. WCC5]|uniref:class I SAM-dependent methyltransferase n=1 Tax=Methanolobus sp. WCC5 TaxID=3125785 RepID=UPI0032448F8F